MSSRPPRPKVFSPQTFGNSKTGNFWVEYPSGLVDLTRSAFAPTNSNEVPAKGEGHLEIGVDGARKIRVDPKQSAIVIIDMQKYV
ncbi:MAG TPA: hypothetical protein VGO47_01210 [Chlamydiales bacterium]|nr:hypothetical protein [Chlamydiales bacterium]